MMHSAWDIETNARALQADRMREAAKARQLEAAGLGGRVWPEALGSRIMQMIFAALARLAGQSSRPSEQAVAASTGRTHMTPALVALEARPLPPVKPIRAAEPYAAMVVVARAAAVPVSERPCGVGDR